MKNWDGKRNQTFYLCFDLFSIIMVADHVICDHDLRKRLEMIVKLLDSLCVILHKMKLPVILQVTADKAMIEEWYSAR